MEAPAFAERARNCRLFKALLGGSGFTAYLFYATIQSKDQLFCLVDGCGFSNAGHIRTVGKNDFISIQDFDQLRILDRELDFQGLSAEIYQEIPPAR